MGITLNWPITLKFQQKKKIQCGGRGLPLAPNEAQRPQGQVSLVVLYDKHHHKERNQMPLE